MSVYSLQVEKHVLGGIIRNQEILPDIINFITAKDFYQEVHSTIFLVIKSLFDSRQTFDKVILAQKIKDIGISFKDEINIFDYIENISFAQVAPRATVEAAKELIKLRIRRELIDTGDEIKSYAKSAATSSIDEIIGQCDKIYSDKISSYEIDKKPVNLFETLADKIEEIGNNPKNDTGLLTSYSEFNRMYGGLKGKNIYAIVSRPGQGKTTWINDLCFNAATKNKVKALVLDTEMSTEDIQFRMTSSISGVPVWYIETGNWRKNPDMVKKVREALIKIKDYEYYHYFVANKTIDEICSITRRWYYTVVGRGNKCIIAYDYIKLTGEKVGANWAEHQAIGEKIDKLKKLAEEIDAPIITAMQMNRSGENFNRKGSEVTDDSSAVALSDRLQWFASFVAIFRRKTVDEITRDGEKFGTHKLIPLKTRFQGKDSAGHHDLVKRRGEGDKFIYQNNYLNFEVKNFAIEEKGSLRDVVEYEEQQFQLRDENENDDGTI